MGNCAACGARLSPSAAWCTQCFAATGTGTPIGESFGTGAAPAPVPAGAVASRFGGAPTAAAPPAAPAPGQFGQFGGVAAPPMPPPAPHAGGYGNASKPPPSDGRLQGGRAIAVTLVAISAGAIYQGAMYYISHTTDAEPEALVRYSIVGALLVYLAVGFLLATQLQRDVVLRWNHGKNTLVSVGIGLLIGGAVSASLLALVSASKGHLAPDPGMIVMVSEGTPANILVTVLIVCVAAPFVEEILFRGLLLESLRRIGTPVALLVSACAFSVWHLNPAALKYYVFAGLLLGTIYLKRGLAGSIAAHVAFNGVLVAAAISIALTPSHLVSAGGVTVRAESGWSTQLTTAANTGGDGAGAALFLTGPSAAEFIVFKQAVPQGRNLTTQELMELVRNGTISRSVPEATIDLDSAQFVTLPAGDAVKVDLSVQGHRGKLVLLVKNDTFVTVVFASAGSAQALSDYTPMMESLIV